MNLCSMTGSRVFVGWKKGRQKDDRPFSVSRKQIYPIRGFKGNRVIYGDSFDCDVSEVESDRTYFVENTEFHHKNLVNVDDEPIYSEPVFARPETDEKDDDSGGAMYQYLLSRGLVTKSTPAGLLISQSLASSHSPDSGYISYQKYQHGGSLSSNTGSTNSQQEEQDTAEKTGGTKQLTGLVIMIIMIRSTLCDREAAF